jgi:hypothetical protein
VEGGRRKGGRGYVHRLDQVATSFFFTNFSEEIKVVDLWPKFSRFGRVGEVYIPNKLDKQGRRFGFVKYRDVKDARELLDRISAIWVGTFKLRVNLSRFEKGGPKAEESKGTAKLKEDIPESSRRYGGGFEDGRSFREALVAKPVQHRDGKEPELQKKVEYTGGGGGGEVVWEVEVEGEALAKLNGSFVGFLSDHKEAQVIQQNFLMDGYPNIRINPLGHLRVLISSSVVGEVKEVVGAVGWWCTWFDRFEEWSPSLVSNHCVSWLKCYGVPLHAWGEALFRTVGFKYGTYLDVDPDTRSMQRGDVARIKIDTDLPRLVDSNVTVAVLGVKFVIRVVEEIGGLEGEGSEKCGRCSMKIDDGSNIGSGDEGSAVAIVEGLSEEDSEGDWSEQGHEVQVVCVQQRRQRLDCPDLVEGEEGNEVSKGDRNLLGNSLGVENSKVNLPMADTRDVALESSRALVTVPEATDGILERVSPVGWYVNKGDEEVTRSRALLDGVDQGGELGQHGFGSGIGPYLQPKTLRTKKGDFSLVSKKGVANKKGSVEDDYRNMGQNFSGPIRGHSSQLASLSGEKLPAHAPYSSLPEKVKWGRYKKGAHNVTLIFFIVEIMEVINVNKGKNLFLKLLIS